MNPKLASGLSVKRWPIRPTDENVLLDGKKCNYFERNGEVEWSSVVCGCTANAGMIVFAAMLAYMNIGVSIYLLPVFSV